MDKKNIKYEKYIRQLKKNRNNVKTATADFVHFKLYGKKNVLDK